jgi:outer membrane protein assembly factor BamB
MRRNLTMNIVSRALAALLLFLVLGPGNLLAQDNRGNELVTAAQIGDIETVTRLLDEGVDVNSKTRYGATALSFAAEKGNLELVKLLVERGADVNVKDSFYNATPLTWAGMGKHKEISDFLKENGAKPPVFKLDQKPADKDKKEEAKSEEKKEVGGGDKQPDTTEAKPEEPEFLPDSAESRLADRAVSSANWPQFRGTGARGIADGQEPPVSWDAPNDRNVLWKKEVPGLGHSCPVIWGDQLFLTTAVGAEADTSLKIGNYGDVDSVEDNTEHRFLVLCLDKRTGEILWEHEAAKGVPLVKRHLKSTHANPTPVTNGEFLVASFAGHGLHCYMADGKPVWSKDLGMLDSGWFYDKSYQWGFASSPVIFEDMVIVQCDVQEGSFVAAFRLADGSEVWRTPREEIPSWSTPTVVESSRGPMLLTHATGFARGYNARTGEEWWRFGKHSEIVVPTPFLAHELIFVTSGYSPIQPIIAIAESASGDVTLPENETSSEHVRWYKPRGGPYMPSPIVYGDYLYLCSNDGRLTCLHAVTGQEVYKERLSEGFEDLENVSKDLGGRLSFVGSPIASDGHIYLPEESGNVIVLVAGPEFKLAGVNPVGEYILTTPAISQGVFYIRGQKHLFAFCLEEESGEEQDAVR